MSENGQAGSEAAGVGGSTEAVQQQRFILLTDIAGSSRLAEQYRAEYYAALERHNAIVEEAVATAGGCIFKNTGDGFFAFFESATGALQAAVELQKSLSAGPQGCLVVFPDGTQFGVRTALHGGELSRLSGQANDWFGPALNRTARICAACHPGQLLISGVVRRAMGALPGELTELDLGQIRLRDLGEPEHLFQLTHPGFGKRQFPPLNSLDNRPHNLSAQPNTFIGRDREVAELAQLLGSGSRLLTIHAPGGYGKSRLAAQLCAQVLWRFEHGGFMVELAALREPARLPEAIAAATGYQFFGSREPAQQVLDYLRGKEMLLCLDNFEHLLDGADFVAELLRTAPRVQLITTSREPLRLSAERVYRLEPLPAGPGSDSVRLFADRAALVRHNFVLDAANMLLVERICEGLEGVPLSIELFAAWADDFSLEDMQAALARQLEITARMRDIPPRQRSVRASLDWSYGLLTPELQTALQRLAVFRGGFFDDAAAAVLEAEAGLLRRNLHILREKSWLYTRELDGQTRHYLRDAAAHEYAAAKLLEAQDTSRAAGEEPGTLDAASLPLRPATLFEQASSNHAAYFSALAGREGPRLSGGGRPDDGQAQLQALKSWRLELYNISEAFATGLKWGHAAWLGPIAEHLYRYLDMTSNYFLARERYGELQEAARLLADPALQVHACIGLGRAQFRLGQLGEAQAMLLEATDLAGQIGYRQGEAYALISLGVVHYLQGDYAGATELSIRALAIARQIGDQRTGAYALNNLGIVHDLKGDSVRANELYSQALADFHAIGERWGETNALNNLGTLRRARGDYASSAELLSQVLVNRREFGDRQGEAMALIGLGIVRELQADSARAAEFYGQALVTFRLIGDRRGEATALGNLGNVQEEQGHYGPAAELYSQALAIFREFGDRRGEASVLGSLGYLHYSQADYGRAAELYGQALAIQCSIKANTRIAVSCAFIGACLTAQGRWPVAALALYGGLAQAAGLGYQLEPGQLEFINAGLSCLDSAVASGEIRAEQLAAWKAEAEAMPLDELVGIVQAALAQVRPSDDFLGAAVPGPAASD